MQSKSVFEGKKIELEDIQGVCDMLINPQDSFILYMLHLGVYEDVISNITKIKTTDVDLENRTIKVNNGTSLVKIDDFLMDILNFIFTTDFYIEGDEADGEGLYYFNMSSPYIIKDKPISSINDGLGAISEDEVKQKIAKLSELIELDLTYLVK